MLLLEKRFVLDMAVELPAPASAIEMPMVFECKLFQTLKNRIRGRTIFLQGDPLRISTDSYRAAAETDLEILDVT